MWIKAEEREAGCDHSLRSPQQTRPSSVAWDQGLAGFGAIRQNHQSILDRQSVLVSGSSGPETKGSGPGSQRDGRAGGGQGLQELGPPVRHSGEPGEEAGGRRVGLLRRAAAPSPWRRAAVQCCHLASLPRTAAGSFPAFTHLCRPSAGTAPGPAKTHHRLKLQALSKNPARRRCWRSVLCARRSASFPERRAPRFPALRSLCEARRTRPCTDGDREPGDAA